MTLIYIVVVMYILLYHTYAYFARVKLRVQTSFRNNTQTGTYIYKTPKDKHIFMPTTQIQQHAQTSGKFLVFVGPRRGQGIGNMLFGLHEAIRLSEWSNRILCVQWDSFHTAFDFKFDKICSNNLRFSALLQSWNFGFSTNVLNVRDTLLSSITHVGFTGNTRVKIINYQSGNFLSLFYPTANFNKTCDTRPEICSVHVRKGDNSHDVRLGSDKTSILLLESYIDKSCYFVTNDVSYYDLVPYKHPKWKSVGHSAIGDNSLSPWCDWFKMLMSKRVYHTPSGLSESAILMANSTGIEICGNIIDLNNPHKRVLKFGYPKC